MEQKKVKKTKGISLALLTVALIASGATIANDSGIMELKQESGDCSSCTIVHSDIVEYLEGEGYSNISAYPVCGGTRGTMCDWIADTDYSYDTYVDCDEYSIIGHEDIPN